MFMFGKKSEENLPNTHGDNVLVAMNHSLAMIEFKPDGTIVDASDLFLQCVGYRRDEIKGQHHRIFCDKRYANSAEYSQFWRDIAAGKQQSGTFERFDKQGNKIMLDATYFPIRNEQGEVTGAMKIANDVTQIFEQERTQKAILDALDKSMAVIEFDVKGNIIQANQNFLATLGYSANEVVGKHHRIFCFDDFYQQNPNFWQELGNGEIKSGQFLRKSASGSNVWIEATYNPVYDEHGKVHKVIKFASDITEEVEKNRAIAEASEIAHSTSVETAQIAKQGANLLADSVEVSQNISRQVQETVTKVQTLNERSKSIEQIVSTIKGIAEQTNLLALNAAIEAARAGDQGRGFAVVADEVRQLASRTAESTSEITDVVNENQALTVSVTSLMAEVADISQQGSDKISEVSVVMDEIHKGAENVSETVMNLTDNH
ncbi:PAS domain-containing methyl-accepting chemotaxis protein [Aliagarivorans taiwanensis]|uniref:methyl-accepting chemotaxis protein n=1 Tax=Aliagarivorans taiwanensis TaxID=561966 RepID=UPI00047B675E